MTSSTPSPRDGALASALVQLPHLSRGELTALAAAAQAFAAAQPCPGPDGRQRSGEGDSPPCRDTGAGQHFFRDAGIADDLDRPAMPWPDPAGRSVAGGLTSTADQHRHRPAAGGTPVGGADPMRLGGRGRLLTHDAEVIDPDLFGSQAFRRRVGPTVPGLCYAAGCDGLYALAQRIDEPLFKVGVTEGQGAEMRMSTLAATRYGSVVREAGRWREEDGFDHWRAMPLPLSRQRGRMSPVRSALRGIAYERPASLPHGALDRAVAAALAPASLGSFAASPAGLAACRAGGIDPASLDRYSPSPLGCPPGRYEQARELVLLGPRADADRVAAMLEAVIAAHVMAQQPI